jgi:oligoendopeptidase F
MWVNGQEKLLNEQVVDWKGEKMPISKAMGIFSDLPKKDRHELYDKINSTLKSISHFAEAEINAVYSYKKVMDEKRGLKKPYTGTVLRYENTEKNIELLVSLVTKYFSISKRFYKIHAKLLGEEKLKYADRGAKIGEIKKKFDFDTSVEIVKNTFEKIDPRYKAYLESYLENGQIDVYPKVGKSGGAFCTSEGKMPTFVLLNHSDDIRSVETLAHEMGHAIHSELTRPQPPHYRGVSMATAEVASTFFEQVVVEELENQLDDKEKIIFLDNKIRGDISTIFRQIACFNFELELHKEIREKGYVPKEDIAKIMSKHMKAYLGDSVEVTDENGYFFVAWSHIRNFFYVYSYAYGQIVSRALFENWKKDKSYAKKIEQFLSSGRSASPEQIFKKIGIDTSKPEFFEAGLKSVEKDIARLEKLARKR